jgi:outer membrane receptor protein involved in Fe transport
MKTKFMISCAAAAVLSGWAVGAMAADTAAAPITTAVSGGSAATAAMGAAPIGLAAAAPDAVSTSSSVEEVVVTANRRSENIQKVPATIQALTGKDLAALNITSFDDALKILPNVTFNNNGPGQGNIFMRGMSVGSAGDQTAATAGNFPNVAVYLDDQSMQFPARNVDVYFVDMERVEVLEGPQGTLFGGGAEAGALRYITNKPKLNLYEGNAEASYGLTEGGGANYSVNMTVNIPVVKDKVAIRAVVYDEHQGGYIDNVASNFTRSNSDLGNYYLGVTPTATGGCPNGQPAAIVASTGKYNGCTLANSPVANNNSVAGKDFNPTTFTGGRFSLLADLNEDWNVLITESVQDLEADGTASELPIGSNFQTLAPLQTTVFSPAFDKDHYENTAWTLNGKVADIKLIYTGAYLSRSINQQEDYSNYSRTGGGMYYQCTGPSTPWGGATTTCYSPIAYWTDQTKNTHLSQEIRASTPDTWRLRGIGGLYYEDFEIQDNMNWDYKTIPDCNTQNLAAATAGGAPCVADVGPAPYSTTYVPGTRGNNVAFGEDANRGYKQFAAFGSFDFDIIPHVLTVTGGTRYYDYFEFEKGSEYYTDPACKNVPDGQCVGQYANFNAEHLNKSYVGFKSKASITWNFSSDGLVYYLFSQGFRPGAFNRSQGLVANASASGGPQYDKPQGYSPDSLNNHEIGLKTQFFDHRLQVNLSAYYMQWDNVQFLFFNPTELGNTTFGVNGPNYTIKGVEYQVVGKVFDGFTIASSGSYNDNTQASSPCLVDNVAASANFGKCITTIYAKGSGVVPFVNPFGTIGSTPAFSPSFKGNIRGTYVWTVFDDYKATAMVGGNYTGSMYNEPGTYASGAGVTIPTTTLLRYLQPAYATMDASFSISKDKWTATLYGTNLFDSHASTFTSSAQFIKSETPLRPTVVGLKVAAKF